MITKNDDKYNDNKQYYYQTNNKKDYKFLRNFLFYSIPRLAKRAYL